MLKKNQIKLFLLGLMAIAITHNFSPVSATDLKVENNPILQTQIEPKAISSDLDNQASNFKFTQKDSLLSKRSGGRSRSGSFKSRPSRSKRSSPSRSYNRRKSTSPSRNYNRREYDSPNYRRDSSPTYYNRSRGYSRRSSGVGGFISFILILLFLGALIFILYYVFNQIFGSKGNSASKAERKIAKERDNDIVTISLLQVVLSSSAEEIQSDLTELVTTVDTNSEEGLVELMRESALTLLRSDRHWTHVFSQSNSLDISKAEAEFDRLSFAERGKFSNESLSNVDGKLKTRQARSEEEEGFPAYVVVTLIIGTADDNPLFSQINSIEHLEEVLLQLSSMREDYLFKFELLWTPQENNEYLTDDELLMEYTNVIPL